MNHQQLQINKQRAHYYFPISHGTAAAEQFREPRIRPYLKIVHKALAPPQSLGLA